MSAMASQITSLTVVYSTGYSGADQRKHQSSASLPFVREIHRWSKNSPHKGPVTPKMFPFDDVIMGLAFVCVCVRTVLSHIIMDVIQGAIGHTCLKWQSRLHSITICSFSISMAQHDFFWKRQKNLHQFLFKHVKHCITSCYILGLLTNTAYKRLPHYRQDERLITLDNIYK